MKRVVVVGGGAAGIFGALRCRELRPDLAVTVLEKAARPLAKVRVSGGGRCNVTHACFDTVALLGHYPRGGRALWPILGRFGPQQTIDWFAQRGVQLKTEPDGRMFPITDSSATIIDCLLGEARRLGVEVVTGTGISGLVHEEHGFKLLRPDRDAETADAVLLATGSNPAVYGWLQELGHHPVPPVPSLFTFGIQDSRLEGLSGVSHPFVRVTLEASGISREGPILITHWGASGPAVLRLSAWGARELAECGYGAALRVDWQPELNQQQLLERMQARKKSAPGRAMNSDPPVEMARRLWASLSGNDARPWREIPDRRLARLSEELKRCTLQISSKGVFKEEFVTAGGVPLAELECRRMESRFCPGLYLAGELLDVDGVTGGFNFQNAWATGYIAGEAIAESL